MPSWPGPMAISHLCRRCRFWAGRKPGYQIHLPCRTTSGVHAHGWQAHRFQSGQAAQKRDDDFYELESDAHFSYDTSHQPETDSSAEALLEQAAQEQAVKQKTIKTVKNQQNESDAFAATEPAFSTEDSAAAVDPTSMSWTPPALPGDVKPGENTGWERGRRRNNAQTLQLDTDLSKQRVRFPAPLDQDAERRDKQETVNKLLATLGLSAGASKPGAVHGERPVKSKRASSSTEPRTKTIAPELIRTDVPSAATRRHATALVRIAMIKRVLPHDISLQDSHEWTKHRGQKVCMHRIQAKLGEQTLSAYGQGDFKELAESRALRMLLENCEERGLVNTNHVESQLQSQEEGLKYQGKAKLHVYNFCARSLEIPEFKVEYLGLEHAPWQCSISWKEKEIKTTAFASTVGQAEVKACNQFKQLIEEREKRSNSEQIRLRDPEYLNLDNADQVLAFHASLTRSKKSTAEPNSQPEKQDYGSVLGSSRWWRKTRYSTWLERLIPLGSFTTEKEATQLAKLITAVQLVKEDPSLFERYKEATRMTDGRVPATIRTLPAKLPPGTDEALKDVPRVLEGLGYIDRTEPESFKERIDALQKSSLEFVHPKIRDREAYRAQVVSDEKRSEYLRRKQENLDLQRSEDISTGLPIKAYRQSILDMIDGNIHSLILGTTGSGKSTQVPQFILERAARRGEGASCNIVSTQPRRIAAVNLAYRVAEERQEQPGTTAGFMISGQQLVGDSGGSITFCTTELLAMQLEHNIDEVCDHTTHIIVDEVHVRSTAQTKLLSALKKAVKQRLQQGKSVPRIILMSATLSSDTITEYFGMKGTGGRAVSVPQVNVPGRRFEVAQKYLDDVLDDLELLHSETIREDLGFEESSRNVDTETALQDQPPIQWESRAELLRAQGEGPQMLRLAATQIINICRRTSEGSILVFLAGWQEMVYVHKLIDDMAKDANDLPPLDVLKLHSNNQDDLHRAVQEPSAATRRILLATDIAETSLTFPDVRYIIDSGKVRSVTTEDLDRLNLIVSDVGKSSMIQRAGRAGRVQAGEYYGLFARSKLASMADFSATDSILHPGQLQALCIRARHRFPSISIHQYFDTWIDPPSRALIDKTIGALKDLDILDHRGDLTEYGQTVASLGISPAAAKIAILGIIMDCITPALILAASMDQNPIYNDVGETARFKGESIATSSRNDHMVQLKCYRFLGKQMIGHGPEKARETADMYGLNFDRFLTVRIGVKRLRRRLRDAGYSKARKSRAVIGTTKEQRKADEQVIAALCFAGRSNHLAVYKNGGTDYTFHTQQGSDAQLRLGSLLRPVNWRPGSKLPNPLEGSLACYSSLMNFSAFGQRLMMVDATPVTYLTAILFADTVTRNPNTPDTLLINNFIPIKFRTKDPTATATLLLRFREKWQNMLNDMLKGYTIRRDTNNIIRGLRGVKGRRIMVQMVVDLMNWEVRQKPGRALLADGYKDMYLDQGVVRKRVLAPERDEDGLVIERLEVEFEKEARANDREVRARRFRKLLEEPLWSGAFEPPEGKGKERVDEGEGEEYDEDDDDDDGSLQ